MNETSLKSHLPLARKRSMQTALMVKWNCKATANVRVNGIKCGKNNESTVSTWEWDIRIWSAIGNIFFFFFGDREKFCEHKCRLKNRLFLLASNSNVGKMVHQINASKSKMRHWDYIHGQFYFFSLPSVVSISLFTCSFLNACASRFSFDFLPSIVSSIGIQTFLPFFLK